MTISKRNRFEVFKRDKFTCQYCGKSAPDVVLQADHIIPRSKGGSDDLMNLVTSCRDCNLGKSDKILSDDSAIIKRKHQMDELQNRREQLEMLMQWHRSLLELDQDLLQGIAAFWDDLVPGYCLNEHGLLKLKQWLEKFGFDAIIDAIKTTTTQYLSYENTTPEPSPTKESVELAFNKICGICITKKRMKDKPYLKDLYYIRGILRNRLSYYDPTKSFLILEEALLDGISVEELKKTALAAENWTGFKTRINELKEMVESNGR
jgi:hypothetical protein